MTKMDAKLCDIQGRLFELAVRSWYRSEEFVKAFMRSDVAKHLDSEYNRLQWAGEEYLLEELIDECGESIGKTEDSLPKDMMFWIGYIYRYWHFYKGEESKKIYRQAPIETMKTNYLMFHTLSPELAIDDLVEIYEQKKVRNKEFQRGRSKNSCGGD